MESKISQIQIKPAKYDKDGDITAQPYASITLNVPIDSKKALAEIQELLTLSSKQWVNSKITAQQQKLPLGENE